MQNESIIKIYSNYLNSDDCNKQYEHGRPEQEIKVDELMQNVNKALTPEAYNTVIEDIESIAYFKEELGFICGFKYAFKMASEIYAR